MTTRQYKKLKGLKKENLRDNMSAMEIVLNMLAEATTTELSKAHQPEDFLKVRRVPVVAAAMPVRFDRILKRIPVDRSLHRRTPHSLMP